jgi:hypothetical protein
MRGQAAGFGREGLDGRGRAQEDELGSQQGRAAQRPGENRRGKEIPRP